MLTAFCIRRAGEPSPGAELRGPGGCAVRLLEEGPLGIWYGEGGVASTALNSVQAHDAVVRAALRSATPVPARLGTLFADEEEIRASLRERRDELTAALERVAGMVEMAIRVEWEEAIPVPAGAPVRTGYDYLAARRWDLQVRATLRERAGALLDEVEARVTPGGSLSVRKLLPEPGVAGSVAHLVHRREAGAYRSRFEAARRELPHVTLRISGPWAPYSFV